MQGIVNFSREEWGSGFYLEIFETDHYKWISDLVHVIHWFGYFKFYYDPSELKDNVWWLICDAVYESISNTLLSILV